MNIAFIINSIPNKSETFILNQVLGVIDAGHRVDIYLADNPGDNLYDVPEELVENLHYWRGMPRKKVIKTIEAMRIIYGEGKVGINRLITLSVMLLWGQGSVSLNLFVTLAKNRSVYDAVLCHYGLNGVRAELARRLGILQGKIATIFHGYDISEYLRDRRKGYYSALFRNGDVFLPVSQRWRNRLIELGCDESKIMVHHMGIDCTKFRYRDRSPMDGDIVRIASVGRLVEKKGFEYSIRAIAGLLKQGYSIEYTIAGDGPLYKDLVALAGKCGAGDHIRLVGWKRPEEVRAVLDEANIFLAPSVTSSTGDQEGIPMSIMEAMASGLLVISTWHSGIPELVEDGVCGYLVNERDPEGIRERIQKVLDDRSHWRGMAESARRRIEERFDLDVQNKKLLVMMEGLVDR